MAGVPKVCQQLDSAEARRLCAEDPNIQRCLQFYERPAPRTQDELLEAMDDLTACYAPEAK